MATQQAAITRSTGLSIKMSKNEVTDVNVEPVPGDMIEIGCQFNSFSITGGTKEEYDITSFCSTAKEFVLGLPDSGTAELAGFFKIGAEPVDELTAAYKDSKNRLFVIEYDDGSSQKLLGGVTQRSQTIEVSTGIVMVTFPLRISGEVVDVAASGG